MKVNEYIFRLQNYSLDQFCFPGNGVIFVIYNLMMLNFLKHYLLNGSAIKQLNMVWFFTAPEGVQKPIAGGYNTTVMEIQWNAPLFPNGPSPVYKVQKTNIALSYPASVVKGTRFTGGGYYAFPPSVFPQYVAFTGLYDDNFTCNLTN